MQHDSTAPVRKGWPCTTQCEAVAPPNTSRQTGSKDLWNVTVQVVTFCLTKCRAAAGRAWHCSGGT